MSVLSSRKEMASRRWSQSHAKLSQTTDHRLFIGPYRVCAEIVDFCWFQPLIMIIIIMIIIIPYIYYALNDALSVYRIHNKTPADNILYILHVQNRQS